MLASKSTWLLLAAALAYVPRISNALRREAEVEGTEYPRGNYVIGTGIYDMTGPASQINFMGYASPEETGHGIHMRLRARAFIVSEPPTAESRGESSAQYRLRRQNREAETETVGDNGKYKKVENLDPDKTICFVSMDIGMGSDLINIRVLNRLEDLLPKQSSSKKRLCHMDNLSLSGTHTHSSPGGFLQYALYQITSAGFSEETTNAYVEGVVQSIVRAYQNLEQGSVSVSEGLLFDANINRSPSSYLLNPQAERDEYATEGDTDKGMLQINFERTNGEPMGLLNWFAVHGTSMNKTNTLISGDNKGYASYLMEKKMNGPSTLPGQGSFVAAFASSNLGDISPNTAGAKCIDTGLPCDFVTSTCNGVNWKCVASGPGKDMIESTEIIGRRQYDMAKTLLHEQKRPISGTISFRHSFIDMSNRTVELPDGTTAITCTAALGYSFAAGTTDGVGLFEFKQSTNTSNEFWNFISNYISKPTKEQIKCHAPKPILVNTGDSHFPYAWDPNSVPVSIFRIGSHFILNVPAEFTTMSGRRLRRAVKAILVDRGIPDVTVSIAGLANSYTHYVTTFEEYAGQRYEAASTLFGPHTLMAYIQEFERLTIDLMDDNATSSKSDDPPKDLSPKQISLIPKVSVDLIGWGRKFGSVAVDANEKYALGNDTVFVSFRSANPRNNLRTEDTFLTVDILLGDGTWHTRYVDGDWSTKFYWRSNLETFGTSFAEISWDVPIDAEQGIYRICHKGTRKTIIGDVSWASLHLPDWMTSEALGSAGVGIMYRTVRLADAFVVKVRETLAKVNRPRLRDFSGCSRSFLVYKQNNTGA